MKINAVKLNVSIFFLVFIGWYGCGKRDTELPIWKIGAKSIEISSRNDSSLTKCSNKKKKKEKSQCVLV